MIMQIINVLVYPGFLFLLVFSLIYSGILRKLAARMQNRVGPPVWQPILDMIKLMKGKDGNLWVDGKLVMKNGMPAGKL